MGRDCQTGNNKSCAVSGHCTKVPRNVNMEKLQNDYLFSEVPWFLP